MVRITVGVEGMACGMCEAHVNDVVRKNFKVKKVDSSHKKRYTEIISEEPIDEDALRAVIESTGYSVITVRSEPYEKKGLRLFGR